MIMTLLLCACAESPAAAATTEDVKVRARLVSDVDEARPGTDFLLGVRFEIDDGWHIYWRNPGGAGLATAVDLDLPEGLAAGPILWPLPVAFTQSEGIPGFGYEGSVVLASRVTAPRGFEPAPSDIVRAEVSWLACKDVCVFGSAELEARLTSLPADPVFGNWEHELPLRLDEGSRSLTVTTTGGLATGTLTLWIRWREQPRSVEWFPDPSPAIEVADVRIQTRGGLTRIDAELRLRQGAEGSTKDLPSVVVITEDDNPRRGWEFSASLKPDEKLKE
jgi:hypothetical protein